GGPPAPHRLLRHSEPGRIAVGAGDLGEDVGDRREVDLLEGEPGELGRLRVEAVEADRVDRLADRQRAVTDSGGALAAEHGTDLVVVDHGDVHAVAVTREVPADGGGDAAEHR